MKRQAIALILFVAVALTAVQADLRLSIRYHDKNIYYPGDEIALKLTLSNTIETDSEDISFYLADDPRQSFGFDLRSLTGEPTPMAEGLVAALNQHGAYRLVHLAPGQELSITASLNEWADFSEPGQYRLTGFFFPRLRDRNSEAFRSDSVLDLTVMPATERRWEDELDQDIRQALIDRALDPWSVVSETLSNRRLSRFNRASLYLDFESLARISPVSRGADSLERALLEGSWDAVPGFEHPVLSYELKASQIYPQEATVRVQAVYEPYGERFERDLRFFLHKKDGYWMIRRVESLDKGDADPVRYGVLTLDPPGVVSELLRAIERGDWEIALRYYDTTDLIRNLPEYIDTWNNMSAVEHNRAIEKYQNQLISGQLEDEQEPLTDIEDWTISRVNYTESEGSVAVENTKTFETAAGPLKQVTMYIFRLTRSSQTAGNWRVIRYDTAIIRR